MAVSSLERFYQFVGSKIHAAGDTDLSPETVLYLWQEHEASLSAIREGLADVDAGNTTSLEEFEQSFRERHGLGNHE